MPILSAALTVPESTPFAVLEDIFLRGSYRVLPTEQEMYSLSADFCKAGMIVRCLDTKKDYVLVKMTTAMDDFGDTVAELSWTELRAKISNTSNDTRALARWTIEVGADLPAGSDVTFSLALARVVALHEIKVDNVCAIEFSETNNALVLDDYLSFNYKISHTFDDPTKLRYGNRYIMPDGTPLNTRYTKVFSNKDPSPDIYVYYKVKNVEPNFQSINSTLTFVALHTSSNILFT